MSLRTGRLSLRRHGAATTGGISGDHGIDDNDREDRAINVGAGACRGARTLRRRSLVAVLCLGLLVGLSLTARYGFPSRILVGPRAPALSGRVSTVHVRQTLTEARRRCSVWLAPSSLPGVDGYGTFTTRDLAAGERILPAHDGVGVPIEGYSQPASEEDRRARRRWIDVWKSYWWARGVPDHVAYEGALDVVDYQIGFGALPNHHCLLDSLQVQYPSVPYDDSLVDPTRDPGAGAFSYHMGREFLTTRPLKAGDEIFLNYGYCTRDRSGTPSWTEGLPMPADFVAAAALVGGLNRPHESPIRYDGASGRLEVLDASRVEDRVRGLLPPTKAGLDALVDGTVTRDVLARRIAEHALQRRSPDWIRRHGMCMENIVPRRSTLPQAGQGAFANFPLAAGEIVAAAPLIQIADRRVLDIHSTDGDRNGTQQQQQQQLLLNYCFGHDASPVLLCPDTNAVLINHCSARTRGCGPGGPNAMYRWSSGWDPTSDRWRALSLEELANQTGRGLAFEVVATRDIQEGEEIFFDYGAEWERAWNEHVARWEPAPRDAAWMSAKEANEQTGPILKPLVSGDLRKTASDRSGLFTGCVYAPSRDDDRSVYHEDVDWKELSDKDILRRYATDGSGFRYWRSSGPSDYRRHVDKIHWPCTVIRRQRRRGADGGTDDDTYLVRIHQSPYARRVGEMPWHRHGVPRLLANYPRASIRYFRRPFASDQHRPGAFRRPIGIRDDLLPAQWRTRAVADNDGAGI